MTTKQYTIQETAAMALRITDSIKPEHLAGWEKAVRANTKNSDGAAILSSVLEIMMELSKGSSPEEAWAKLDDSDISGARACIEALIVAHFHLRGEEFRLWYNKRYYHGLGGGERNPENLRRIVAAQLLRKAVDKTRRPHAV